MWDKIYYEPNDQEKQVETSLLLNENWLFSKISSCLSLPLISRTGFADR